MIPLAISLSQAKPTITLQDYLDLEYKWRQQVLERQHTTKEHLCNEVSTQESKRLIKEIFELLRRLMEPMGEMVLPHTINYKRKHALIDRYNSITSNNIILESNQNIIQYKAYPQFVTISKDKISLDERDYKDNRNNEDENTIKFPFLFEILGIPIIGSYGEDRENLEKDGLIFVGGVNYSITPAGDSGRNYFSDNNPDPKQYTFSYDGKGGDSIIDLLNECGYVGVNDPYNRDPKNQKQPCVIIAHLVSPNIKYVAGYGKGFIDLHPYADVIAEAVVELCKKLPSRTKYDRHLRNTQREKEGKEKIKSVLYYEDKLIRDRWNKIKQREGWHRRKIYLKEWVQSSVWYNLNKIYLIPLEIPTTDNTRDYVTANISKICAKLEKDWTVTREEVGITASTRAFLYVDGSWRAVDISNIKENAMLGTDQVFIEKRGGIDQVTNFVGHYGIAFCNTQGHFVVYAEELIKAAKESDGHIETITDFDCAGLNIAERVMVREEEEEDYDEENLLQQPDEDDNFIQRLGIDPIDTLMYFDLKREDVEQIYPLKLEKNDKGNLKRRLKIGKDSFPLMNPSSNVTNPIVRMANKYYENPEKYWRYKYIVDELGYLLGSINLKIMDLKYKGYLKSEKDENGKSKKFERFKIYEHVSEHLNELIEGQAEEAKRIEIDAVIEELSIRYGDGKGGEMFGNYIMDMMYICFPERNYNRGDSTKCLPTEYFGNKFKLFPKQMRRKIIGWMKTIESIIQDKEEKIKTKQRNMKGFQEPRKLKKANIKRLANVVIQNPIMIEKIRELGEEERRKGGASKIE